MSKNILREIGELCVGILILLVIFAIYVSIKGSADCGNGLSTFESKLYGWFGGTYSWEETILLGKHIYKINCYTGQRTEEYAWDSGQCLGLFAILFLIGGVLFLLAGPSRMTILAVERGI
jgi:hypothetical protein